MKTLTGFTQSMGVVLSEVNCVSHLQGPHAVILYNSCSSRNADLRLTFLLLHLLIVVVCPVLWFFGLRVSASACMYMSHVPEVKSQNLTADC